MTTLLQDGGQSGGRPFASILQLKRSVRKELRQTMRGKSIALVRVTLD